MDIVHIQTFRLVLDSKRRPTLPHALLEAADMDGLQELVGYCDSVGRIVLEDPARALRTLQDKLAPDLPEDTVAEFLTTREARARQERSPRVSG